MPVNTPILNKYIAVLPPALGDNLKREAEEMAPLLESLERNECPPTQNHYGVYLKLVKDYTSIALCLAAGGNRLGIIAAAQLNGVKGMDYQSALICNVAK
jgi:hypothetical protein